MMKQITVLLSDDHSMVREGLRVLLDAAEDITVVGEVENGRRAVEETRRLLPEVVLLDISMPVLNGIDAARQIATTVPFTKVLILSAYGDDQYVEKAMEAGAVGFIVKQTAAHDLLEAVRDVAGGNAFFSPSVASRLFQHGQKRFLDGWPLRNKAALLTSRQTEVLQLIAEGCPNKRIAGLLSISIKTVEKHRQELMDRLDIHSTAMLTRYAVSMGVVESNRWLQPDDSGWRDFSPTGG